VIKFFRHIRKALLMENRTGKYFKYAIGEIVLVVIGILIALQINNWNENRIAQNSKTQYCEQLLEEIEFDIQGINDQIERLEGDIKSYNSYVAIYETPDISIDTIYKNIKKVPASNGLASFNTKTIEVLKSTGDIKLFSNKIQTQLVILENRHKYYFDAHKANYGIYMSTLAGSYLMNALSIERKLANQERFTKALNFKEKLPDQLAKMHLGLTAKGFADKASLDILKNILKDIEELKVFIVEELEIQ